MTDESFNRIYKDYVTKKVRPARQRTRAILKQWGEPDFWAEYTRHEGSAIPSPVQHTHMRIKRPESVLDKFRRDSAQFPQGPKSDNIHLIRDILGARVIVYFPAHLRMIDQEIRSGRGFEIYDEAKPKCYLPLSTVERIGIDPETLDMQGMKPSGYSSIHYIVRCRTSGGMWFELQARTMLENVWGEIEHQLGYKPKRQTAFSVSRQFRVISHHLAAIDDHFDFMYDQISYLQSQSEPDDGDLLNAENLPRILEGMEMQCAQSEIDGILEILDSFDFHTVNDFTSRVTPEILEALRAEYAKLANGGRLNAFHLVNSIATLTAKPSVESALNDLRQTLILRNLTYEIREQVKSDTSRKRG